MAAKWEPVCSALPQKYAAEKYEVNYFLPFAYTHLSHFYTEPTLFVKQEELFLFHSS